jgi:hypothetical protein
VRRHRGYLITPPLYFMVAKSLNRGENPVALATIDFTEAVLPERAPESRDCLLGR